MIIKLDYTKAQVLAKFVNPEELKLLANNHIRKRQFCLAASALSLSELGLKLWFSSTKGQSRIKITNAQAANLLEWLTGWIEAVPPKDDYKLSIIRELIAQLDKYLTDL